MWELESPHSRHMINSCTCFSHLSLCKVEQVTGTLFSEACDISNSLQKKVQVAKKKKRRRKVVFSITLRYKLQRGSLTALIDGISTLWSQVAGYVLSLIHTVRSDPPWLLWGTVCRIMKLSSNRRSKYLCLEGQPGKQPELINKPEMQRFLQ